MLNVHICLRRDRTDWVGWGAMDWGGDCPCDGTQQVCVCSWGGFLGPGSSTVLRVVKSYRPRIKDESLPWWKPNLKMNWFNHKWPVRSAAQSSWQNNVKNEWKYEWGQVKVLKENKSLFLGLGRKNVTVEGRPGMFCRDKTLLWRSCGAMLKTFTFMFL